MGERGYKREGGKGEREGWGGWGDKGERLSDFIPEREGESRVMGYRDREKGIGAEEDG